MDAILDRTDIEAKPAADAILFADNNAGTRVDRLGFPAGADVVRAGRDDVPLGIDEIDTLVRGVVAGDVTEVTANAFLLVDARDGLKGKIEILEIGDARKAKANHIGDCREAFFVHPVGETVAEVFDDAKAIVHDGGADLKAAGAEEKEFGGVAPSGDTTHAGDGESRAMDDRIAAESGEHVEGDGLDGGTGITAVAAASADIGGNFERFQVDADDGVERVDQGDGAGSGCKGGARGDDNVGDVGRELDDDGNFGDFHDPAGDMLALLGDLANRAAHAALAHDEGTSKFEI